MPQPLDLRLGFSALRRESRSLRLGCPALRSDSRSLRLGFPALRRESLLIRDDDPLPQLGNLIVGGGLVLRHIHRVCRSAVQDVIEIRELIGHTPPDDRSDRHEYNVKRMPNNRFSSHLPGPSFLGKSGVKGVLARGGTAHAHSVVPFSLYYALNSLRIRLAAEDWGRKLFSIRTKRVFVWITCLSRLR